MFCLLVLVDDNCTIYINGSNQIMDTHVLLNSMNSLNIGKQETEVDNIMLRSILSQMEFTHIVRQFYDSGVPFRSHLHVPEVHPHTGDIFCKREDEGHILKVNNYMPCTIIMNVICSQ